MAKVLIDISEEDFDFFKRTNICRANMSRAIKNGIVLDNLANGEVIQNIFPDAKFYCTERLQTAGFPRRDADFDLDWWNSKWKGEVK